MHPAKIGIIFDLDGTLIDTLDDITDSLNVAFAARGLPALERLRVRELIGEGLRNLIQRASGNDQPAALDELVLRYRAAYTERMYARTRPYPKIEALLDALCAAGVPMAILSNKSHEFTVPLVQRLLPRWPFAGVRGSDASAARKPDPGSALTLAGAMDRSPDAVWFVGDSDVDIETAHNAGMTSVAVTWGYRDLDTLVPSRPNHIIDRPQQLLELLGGLEHSRGS